MSFEEVLSYDDILLEPQYSDISTRKNVNISSNMGNGLILNIPIIASPMDTISETAMGSAMSKLGGAAIIHRYNSIEEQVELMSNVIGIKAAAIGATGDFKERAQELCKNDARLLCVDIAHGHHVIMKNAVEDLAKIIPDDVHLMVGNVATAQGYLFIDSLYRVNSVRVGVGSGSICSTRIRTGHGLPMVTTIMEAARARKAISAQDSPKIIADGGIRNSGDIVKALALGADAVMVGSLIAGTTETPGRVEGSPNARFKSYRGMASSEAQSDWRGYVSVEEGVSTTVPYRGDVAGIVNDVRDGILSGLSYSGARNIEGLREKVRIFKQSHAAQVESSTHILRRT